MESDPQNIWQNQQTERTVMSLEEIKQRLNRLEAKGRIEAFTLIVIGLLLSPCFGLMAVRARQTIPQVGWCVVTLWCLYSAWRGFRLLRTAGPPGNSPLATSLEFYRSELEKRRDRIKQVWRASGLTWLFAGLALIVTPELEQWIKKGQPFLALLSVWLVAFFFIRARQVRRLQQEIDELHAMSGRS